MNVDFYSQVAPAAFKWLLGIIFAGFMSVILWPFRKARKEWGTLRTEQASIHAELVQQRTNCLATLQAQGVQQIELLGKTVAALDGVRLDLAEQTGYLKAAMVQPIRRRRTAKK